MGFPLRKPEKLVKALHHTHRILWIRSTKKTRLSKQGQMLGFARATSDGALTATIWDVAVCASRAVLPCSCAPRPVMRMAVLGRHSLWLPSSLGGAYAC